MLLLATIPHTGTMFMHKLIIDHGIPWHPLGQATDGVAFSHVGPREMNRIRAFEGPIVSTMRERWKIERSWARDTNKFGFTLEESFSCFAELDPLIINIDGDHRDKELQAFSELLGVNLKTDWSVVNGHNY